MMGGQGVFKLDRFFRLATRANGDWFHRFIRKTKEPTILSESPALNFALGI
jgi:hypothetical protein